MRRRGDIHTRGSKLPERNDSYRPLSSEKLAEILKMLPRRPLMAGEDGIRLSLAGAQDKIAVHVPDDQISLPLGGAPSTHILKPAIEHFEGVVFNEAFCMKLAHAIGLHTAKAEVGRVENIDYLLIAALRPHRVEGVLAAPKIWNGNIRRIFARHLALSLKINTRTKAGLRSNSVLSCCVELSSAPVIDLQHLLDAVIFNFLIGNHDAHGKNFSLLYGSETRLAPLYDVLSTAYYPDLSKKMAMKIGGEYASEKVGPKNFDQLANEAGLAKPMVKRRVQEVAETVLSKTPELITGHQTIQAVAALIQNRCTKALEKFGS